MCCAGLSAECGGGMGEWRPVRLDQSRMDADQRDGSNGGFAGVVSSPGGPLPHLQRVSAV